MDEPERRGLPVIPVILNTFDPPNQPTPRRCVALGHALRELVAEWPEGPAPLVYPRRGVTVALVDAAGRITHLLSQVAPRKLEGAGLAWPA